MMSQHHPRLFASICIMLLTFSATASAMQDLDLSQIGITNDETEFRVQSKVGAMDVDTAVRKLAEQLETTKAEIRNQFCDQPPTDQLCATGPKDNTDFSELFVYMFIMAAAQNPFDIFSWQAFVAANWPLEENGSPAKSLIGQRPGLPRAWSTYKTPREVFDPAYADPTCSASLPGQPVLYTSTFRQTGGLPLIDKNGNYVVYDLRVNDVYADYIVANGLDTVDGQIAFAAAGGVVDIPLGYYDDPIQKTGGAEAATAIKSAWKIVDPDAVDTSSRYFTMKGKISVAARDSANGKPFCIEARLALVGMHIMLRTRSGNGPQWTWSTFEHIDNAPFADNARKPVDTLHEELFPGGCSAQSETSNSYSFFDPDCKDCKTNHLEKSDWKWSLTAPYANPGYQSQVVRCWDVFEGTRLVNSLWQEKLSGTVWANYESSSAQWRGAKKSMLFPNGEVPRFLVNSTLETYSQYSNNSSCLGCHATAKTTAGQDANFSFVLALAAKFQAEIRAREMASK